MCLKSEFKTAPKEIEPWPDASNVFTSVHSVESIWNLSIGISWANTYPITTVWSWRILRAVTQSLKSVLLLSALPLFMDPSSETVQTEAYGRLPDQWLR